MSRVIMMGEEAKTNVPLPPASPESVGTLILVVGAVIALVGWIDVLLIWIPPNFASIDWEFGTVSGTFDALPLGTVGLTAILIGALYRPSNWPVYALGVLFWLITLFLIGAVVIYLLTLPAIVKATPAALANTMKSAVAKTLMFEALYVFLYAWLGWFTLRRARRRAAGHVA